MHISIANMQVFIIPVSIFQGFLFYRLYIIGHEASHGLLFIDYHLLNKFAGTFILFPILTPLSIFRVIHQFHHKYNRKNAHTSSLDTFVIHSQSCFIKVYYYAIWYISVFCGGFFFHSLVSVILFLFVPPFLANRISPAFQGWNLSLQLQSISEFMLALFFHILLYKLTSQDLYMHFIGYPFISFAFILSSMLYIFHYRTTNGEEARFHARSLRPSFFLSWILLNFNEHATHHQKPNIPWYDLPSKRMELPSYYKEKNETVSTFLSAILQQWKGPTLIYEPYTKSNS